VQKGRIGKPIDLAGSTRFDSRQPPQQLVDIAIDASAAVRSGQRKKVRVQPNATRLN
jgi:hypothetical protein